MHTNCIRGKYGDVMQDSQYALFLFTTQYIHINFTFDDKLHPNFLSAGIIEIAALLFKLTEKTVLNYRPHKLS